MNYNLENINYELIVTIVALLALVIAVISLFVAIKSTKKQTISLIRSQLSEKAYQCNRYLNPQDLSHIPDRIDKVSGILSSIITAEEILFRQKHFKSIVYFVKKGKQPSKVETAILQNIISLWHIKAVCLQTASITSLAKPIWRNIPSTVLLLLIMRSKKPMIKPFTPVY